MSTAQLVKIGIIGNAQVGKSSLMKRFVEDEFKDEYIHTIGVEFATRTVEFRYDATKLQIWDIAGDERFRTIISSYYRGSSGYIIMYDVTDIKSFNHVSMWFESVAQYARSDVNPCIILVGNKSDVDESSRVVSAEEGRELANQLGIPFFETSSKNASNVDDVFLWMVTGVKSNSSSHQNVPSQMCK